MSEWYSGHPAAVSEHKRTTDEFSEPVFFSESVVISVPFSDIRILSYADIRVYLYSAAVDLTGWW
jgi:ABC-type amino acid transport substrate-binding protein